MKAAIVNIATKTVEMNGNTCNFYEAGLTNNADPVTPLTDETEIQEVLEDRYGEIEVTFA
ncbi:hypothetical protein [Spirosoma oryzae]|nr:hypothetical protein [Spirosoma oryzae]